MFFGIKEDKITIVSCFRLALFGLFIFLLIWESKSKYLVNFIPIIYLVSIDGISQLHEYIKKKRGFINV